MNGCVGKREVFAIIMRYNLLSETIQCKWMSQFLFCFVSARLSPSLPSPSNDRIVCPSVMCENEVLDLGNGSCLIYFSTFLESHQADIYLQSLNNELPWTRPTLSIFGRRCTQPRETCYIASEGLPHYKYSGYEPIVHKWDDFPNVKCILDSVHKALPDCTFNSVLLNRYVDGTDYVAWHSDNENLYGPTPTIASVTLGAQRDFLIRRKNRKSGNIRQHGQQLSESETAKAIDVPLANAMLQTKKKRERSTTTLSDVSDDNQRDLYTFSLNHGSMLVMKGCTQRDWEHSLPRRKRIDEPRINLTFRYIVN